MGKALVIRGADFSDNALAQITIISEEVRALFTGQNVGEKGMFAFQKFINSIGGLNGTLWGKVGKMYVPMLFESDTAADDTFFDVKNNEVHTALPSQHATTSYLNNCLTITTTPERTTALPFAVGDSGSLSSLFGIVDANFANVANNIYLKTGYTAKWVRSSGKEWTITRGKTISAGGNTLSIATFSDNTDNSAVTHGFVKNDGTSDSETSSLTGTNTGNRIPYINIDPSGANVSMMVFGYFTSGITDAELKTVASALYKMYLDVVS